MRPAAIVAFEWLFILKIAIGVVVGFYLLSLGTALLPSDIPPDAARFLPWMMGGGVVIGALIDLVLLYLIARRRSNGARWVLAVLFAIGMINLVRMQAAHQMALPLVSTLSIAAQLLLDAICLWLLFGKDARPWFRR